MPPTPLLRIGYVALNGAAPLLVADELGFFARQRLRVFLSEEGAWAAIRDKATLGALDGAHMLGPLPIALACGLGGVSARLSVGAGIGCSGNIIALSHASADEAGAAGRGRRRAHRRRHRRRASAGRPREPGRRRVPDARARLPRFVEGHGAPGVRRARHRIRLRRVAPPARAYPLPCPRPRRWPPTAAPSGTPPLPWSASPSPAP